MTPRDWLEKHWWLILWGLIVLAVMALTELLPVGQAESQWAELIH